VVLRLEKDGRVIETRLLGGLDRAPRVFSDPTEEDGYFLNAIALNEDGSLNSRESPAPPGSQLRLFLNGAGKPQSPVQDGVVSRPPLHPLGVPVQVRARERELEVASATAAEGHVAGVWQVAVRIPRIFHAKSFSRLAWMECWLIVSTMRCRYGSLQRISAVV